MSHLLSFFQNGCVDSTTEGYGDPEEDVETFVHGRFNHPSVNKMATTIHIEMEELYW